MKNMYAQDLIGRLLTEDPNFTRNGVGRFCDQGLDGSWVEIIATWLEEGSVKVLARDAKGHTAVLPVSLYMLSGRLK
jgi:hypothetical protein